ncbi:MAG: restriction endonuclease subunit S [Bryobacterales bacterium]|nr:restriction endonuclease subunit S [Bryobacterales bacterium]
MRDVLRRHVPDREVLAFGSRAKWTAKDYSDLDLAIMGEEPLSLHASSALDEALVDSDLPFRVDIVDWARIDEGFRAIIRRSAVSLQVLAGDNARPYSGHEMPLGPSRAVAVGEWPTLSLREAGVALFDCVHRTPPAEESGYPYVGIPQVRDGRIDLVGARRISRQHFEEWTKRSKPEPLDVVLSRRCNPGTTAFVPEGLEFALGQNLVLLRANGARVSQPFLRWLVRGPQWWEQVGKYLNVGAVFDSLKCADIPDFELLIPPLSEQHAIAHILGTLDDKIELNRRMNETLEAMARALFKSWFVDFDPVRSKMEGRSTGLPHDIADLFPDQMVDSEMGEIPVGWHVASLSDLAALRRKGSDPKSEASDTPYIGLADMPRGSIALTDWGEIGSVSSRKTAFKAGDVLFGKLRPYFHKVGIAPVDGLCSTDIIVLSARKSKWSSFVLACVSSSALIAHASQTATGTKMPRTSWQAMSGYELCRPTDAIALEFQRIVLPMVGRIVENVHESRTLAALRDTLLPKLISGEIRVPRAERTMESTT